VQRTDQTGAAQPALVEPRERMRTNIVQCVYAIPRAHTTISRSPTEYERIVPCGISASGMERMVSADMLSPRAISANRSIRRRRLRSQHQEDEHRARITFIARMTCKADKQQEFVACAGAWRPTYGTMSPIP